mmetsp:Transcript_13355/g.40406  ORF Transcript_13355/g.40406 Transcript_13355/m.40406 type:complete len:799 (-) Transcript_13355:644-3040(-)
MKNFKAQEIDTPGVIRQVSHLFQGHNKLILGFNTFLPDGYKIGLPGNDSGDSLLTIPVPSHEVTSTCSIPTRQRQPLDSDQLDALSHARLGPRRQAEPFGSDASITATDGSVSGCTSTVTAVGAPKEFDHAITYVTTIKKRFAHAPETYKAFLEILHTYQKEQRSIKDVLEQVSQLFADHADLLQEFTYFLPDAVQEQAKERLTRAARESELRRERSSISTIRTVARDIHAITGERLSLLHGKQVADERLRRSNGIVRDGSGSAMQSVPQRVTAPMPSRASATCDLLSKSDDNTHVHTRSPSNRSHVSRGGMINSCQHRASERNFLERVKAVLCLNTRHYQWPDFLKCLDLYSQGLIQRSELIHLLSGLLGKRSELLEELKRSLVTCPSVELTDESLAQTSMSSWTTMPLMELEVLTKKQCSPSYCALPTSSPPGMSDLDAHTCLNNRWVLQAADSDESHSYQNSRENHYEKVLFKCESERVDIDMIIDSGICAIRALEPLEQELNMKGTWQQYFASRLRWSLSTCALSSRDLHVLERVYGGYAAELLRWLMSYPEVALPVVLRRLRRKVIDWRFARQDITRHWQVPYQRNFCRALEHRSCNFQQGERRSFFAGRLNSECTSRACESVSSVTKCEVVPKDGENVLQDIAMSHNENAEFLGSSDIKAARVAQEQTFVVMRSSKPFLHDVLRGVLRYAADQSNLSQYDKKLLYQLWDTLLSPLFGLPQSSNEHHGSLHLRHHAPVQADELKETITAHGQFENCYIQSSCDLHFLCFHINLYFQMISLAARVGKTRVQNLC